MEIVSVKFYKIKTNVRFINYICTFVYFYGFIFLAHTEYR